MYKNLQSNSYSFRINSKNSCSKFPSNLLATSNLFIRSALKKTIPNCVTKTNTLNSTFLLRPDLDDGKTEEGIGMREHERIGERKEERHRLEQK